jgi:hypothetical protein
MNRPPDEHTIRRYLLAELEESDVAAVDESILGDDEFFEFVRAIEEDLIAEYVAGDFSPAERERFERCFLTSSDRRRRTEVARLLSERGDGVVSPPDAGPRGSGKPARSRWVRAVRMLADQRLAAAIAVGITVGGMLWWSTRPSSPDQEASAPTVTPTSPASEPSIPARPGSAVVLAVSLTSGLVRGAGPEEPVVLTPEVQTVQLRLEREQGFTATPNVVSIETPEGRAVWDGAVVVLPGAAADDPLVIDVPADALGTADYLVFLYLDEAGQRLTLGEYALSIRRGPSP